MSIDTKTDLEVAERLERALPLFFRGVRYKLLVELHHGVRESLPEHFPRSECGFTSGEKAQLLARHVYYEIGTETRGLSGPGSEGKLSYAGLPQDLAAAKKFIEDHFQTKGWEFGTTPIPVP